MALRSRRGASRSEEGRRSVARVDAAIEGLWTEVRELSLGTSPCIDRLDTAPSPLQFLRQFVLPNKPCIISHAITDWPALSNWTQDEYLCQVLADCQVSLHLTPDGRADALVPNPYSTSSLCFASPHVEQVRFPVALKHILDSSSPSAPFVAYAQEQNDCFRSEYSPLAPDIEPHIPWASEALGCLPEAVNIWIGNHRSETSFHKDHYENLYVVVTGKKHFLLLPPTDVHRMYIRDYPAARYKFSEATGKFSLELEKPLRYVPWCSIDPFPSSFTLGKQKSEFPRFFRAPEPFRCTLSAGEILYLPSLWFHHVRQSPDDSGRTIAINYWYDMQFDIKYVYNNFLQSIDHVSDDGIHEEVDGATIHGIKLLGNEEDVF